MLKITNTSGRSLNICGNLVKSSDTICLDIPYEVVKNLDRNRFILVQEIPDEPITIEDIPSIPEIFEEPIVEEPIVEEIEVKPKKSRRKRNKK